MYYKRNEPFRYSFGQPVQAMIEAIQKEEQGLVSTGKWEAAILDLSPNGMKIASSANIEPSEDLQIRTSFMLNKIHIEINGKISWKKSLGRDFEYGIAENNSDQIKDLLISQLKVFARTQSKRN